MQTASSDFDWNDTTIGRLRALWAEGHSTAELAAASARARTPSWANRTAST
jgi:hypothetical protein